MGVRQKEMVKARLFRTPFAELRNRHVFLERRGLYRTPHKGQSQSGNPALRDVLRPTEGDFVAGVARASPDEYEVFKRLLAREEEEMEEEEEEDEDEEEEEDGGGEELPAGDAAQDGGRCRDGYPGRPPPPRPLSASPRAEWGPAARPGSLLTRQLQELWRRSRSSLVPQRLLFEVTSASVVSERSSKYVVSASAGPQRRPRVRVGGRSLLSVSPRAALMAPRLR